jgi:hypothetical protein
MFLHVDASNHDGANGPRWRLSGTAPTTAGAHGKNPVPLRRKTC